MPKMSKAQAKKRILEIDSKLRKVFFDFNWYELGGITVTQRNKDINTVQVVLEKLLKALK